MNADKKQIWVNGQFVEVTDDVYTAYMKGDRKIRYFESDLKVERTVLNKDGTIKKVLPSREDSLDRLMDNNAEQFPDRAETVDELVFRRMTEEILHEALGLLTEEELSLIKALFYENQTERQYAEQLGISQPAVHKQKNKILAKLKLFLKN